MRVRGGAGTCARTSYLPEDIEHMGYVPHGMQGCIANMRGRRANRREKGLPDWTPPIV